MRGFRHSGCSRRPRCCSVRKQLLHYFAHFAQIGVTSRVSEFSTVRYRKCYLVCSSTLAGASNGFRHQRLRRQRSPQAGRRNGKRSEIPRIEDGHTKASEIPHVARREGDVMFNGSRCDQAIRHRKRSAFQLGLSGKYSPTVSYRLGHRQES